MMKGIGSVGRTFFLVLILMGPLLLWDGDQSWHRDWHYFEHQAHVASLSLVEGSPADWNPWHCAGMDQAENPQGLSTSPFFGLVMMMGPGLGLRLACLFFLALGAASMCWMLRKEELSPEASLFGGLLWGVLPFMGVHLSEGHVPFVGFALMPLALGLMKMSVLARDRLLMILLSGGVGAVLAAQISFGGIYPFVFTCLVLGFFVLWHALHSRCSLGFVALFFALVFGILLGLPRILPALDLMQRIPRVPLWEDHLSPSLFLRGVFSRVVETSPVEGHPYHWPEYVFYPGVLLLALVLWGQRKRLSINLPVGLWVSVGFLLMIGDFFMSPYRLLGAFPLVGDLQVPSRFVVLSLFGLVIWASIAADGLLKRDLLKRRWVLLLLFLVVLENWSLSAQWLVGAPTEELVTEMSYVLPKNVGPMERADIRMDRAPALGQVVSNCYEPGPKIVPPILQGKSELGFVDPPGDVSLSSPGEIQVKGEKNLVLGQVYRENWAVSGGRVEKSSEGLTRVLSTSDGLTMHYQNPSRELGLRLQLITAISWVLLYLFHRRETARAG